MFLLLSGRLVTILRVLAHFSPLNSNKGRFVVALRGIDYTSGFLIKSWITTNPIKSLVTGVVGFILVNSYALYLFERQREYWDLEACFSSEAEEHTVRSMRDAIWLAIITFVTVGFGDFYPRSELGRYISIVITIGGLLYSATIIGLVHSALNLTSEENGVLLIIANQRKDKAKKMYAATLIMYLLKMAGVRHRNLRKANIHWFKTRAAKNLKFNLFITVQKFKKAKHDLDASNPLKHQDQ